MLKLKVLLDGVTIFERDYPSQEEKDKCRERHIKNNEEDKTMHRENGIRNHKTTTNKCRK